MGIFWKKEVDSGSVTLYIKLGRPIFWEGGVDYGSVAYSCQKMGVSILGGMCRFSVAYRCLNGGIFREGGVDYARVTYIFKRDGIYSGREG